MRILAIGDFHGKFNSAKWKKIIKKKKVDLVVAVGDYMAYRLRDVFFKHIYANRDTEIELWDVVGKKKYKEKILADVKDGNKIIEKLNKLGVPVIAITGNGDRGKWPDITDSFSLSKIKWDFAKKAVFGDVFKKCKNVKLFDYSSCEFGGYRFIGKARSSFPGVVKSKTYKKYRGILEKLFKKYRKENKERKLIFVSHNVPYNSRLDKIMAKGADKRAKGKHYGSKMARRLVDKWQPKLFIGGHIHEGQGKQMLGKTICVNVGDGCKGQGALIDIFGKKVSVKFVK